MTTAPVAPVAPVAPTPASKPVVPSSGTIFEQRQAESSHHTAPAAAAAPATSTAPAAHPSQSVLFAERQAESATHRNTTAPAAAAPVAPTTPVAPVAPTAPAALNSSAVFMEHQIKANAPGVPTHAPAPAHPWVDEIKKTVAAVVKG